MADSSKRRDGTVALQRYLRRESTDAERTLCRLVRNRQIADAKFRRQHQFGPYVLDFFCQEECLVIEVDGGQHYEDEVAEKDAARTRYLAANGLRVLRFTNLDILKQGEAVAQRILDAIRGPSP